MRLIFIFFLLLSLTWLARAATFEAECRTKTALHAAIVTKIKLAQQGVMWLGEAVIPDVEAERIFIHVQDTHDEITFDTFIKRNEKTVGASETEILWRDEDAKTGYPAIDNPEATANIVITHDSSGARSVVTCCIHQN